MTESEFFFPQHVPACFSVCLVSRGLLDTCLRLVGLLSGLHFLSIVFATLGGLRPVQPDEASLACGMLN